MEILTQSPAGREQTKGTPATKAAEAATPQCMPRDICVIAILKTFLTQEEIILIISAHIDHVLPTVAQE